MRNWKTTSAGATAIVAAISGLIGMLGPLFDGDPATAPDWAGIGVAIGAVVAGVGLLVARDDETGPPVVPPPTTPGTWPIAGC